MMMQGFWEFIWVALDQKHQSKGLGTLLTEHRLDYVREHDGTSVLLVTQKPQYFNRFGFLTDRDHGNGWTAMFLSTQTGGYEMKGQPYHMKTVWRKISWLPYYFGFCPNEIAWDKR